MIFTKRFSAGIDIQQLLTERRQVAVVWGTEDVQNVRPDLNEDESWEVLQACRENHDCEYGFNWRLIEIIADDLFPKPDDADEEGERS